MIHSDQSTVESTALSARGRVLLALMDTRQRASSVYDDHGSPGDWAGSALVPLTYLGTLASHFGRAASARSPSEGCAGRQMMRMTTDPVRDP